MDWKVKKTSKEEEMHEEARNEKELMAIGKRYAVEAQAPAPLDSNPPFLTPSMHAFSQSLLNKPLLHFYMLFHLIQRKRLMLKPENGKTSSHRLW